MGFSAGNVVAPNLLSTKTPDSNELTIQELEFLLNLIRNITFKGDQLEPLYNLVIKIQNQHKSKIK